MKKLLLFFLSFTFLNTYAQGIEFFQGTFDEAKALAEKEGKIIFMDAFAEWCGPCKRMARDVFPTKEAGDYFNEKFINVKMDMEKGEGRALAQKYRVGSYPTLLFLDFTGEVVFETKGARTSAAALIALGVQALKPNESTILLQNKKWLEGNRDAKFLMEYIETQAVFNKDYNTAFEAYLNALTPENKKDTKVLDFILRYTNAATSPGMKFISENKSSIKTTLGAEKFDTKIIDIAMISANASKETSSLNEAKEILNAFKPKGYKEQLHLLDVRYYGAIKDWKTYDKVVTKYLSKYKKGDDIAYNKVAWNYYMNIDDAKQLAKAEKWMQDAIKTNNSYNNNLTQSYLLYKMERFSEAQDAVEYALILAKNGTNETKNAEILKKKIEEALEGKKTEVVIDYKLD